jgi:hypothetical protein
MHDRLFVLQVVTAIEEQWFAAGYHEIGGSPVRTERTYVIEQKLFAARDEEDAFGIATHWLPGFSDANHDGRGHLTVYFAIGIHELEEVAHLSEVAEKTHAHDLYAFDLPSFNCNDIDSTGMPLVRQKEKLEIFRLKALRDPTEKKD